MTQPHYGLGWPALLEYKASGHQATVTSPQQQSFLLHAGACVLLMMCVCVLVWKEEAKRVPTSRQSDCVYVFVTEREEMECICVSEKVSEKHEDNKNSLS